MSIKQTERLYLTMNEALAANIAKIAEELQMSKSAYVKSLIAQDLVRNGYNPHFAPKDSSSDE